MYIGNPELGKINIGKFLKRSGIGKFATAFLPGAIGIAAQTAIAQLEKKTGHKATPEEIEALKQKYPATPELFGVPWYLPVAGVGLIGLLLFMRKRR